MSEAAPVAAHGLGETIIDVVAAEHRRIGPCGRDDGFRLVTLTNSPPNPGGPSPLESAGLGGFFERQFSVDTCRTYKPARAVYDYVCRELQVVPAECMMVAAHVWDTIGAQSAGFSAALITRPGNGLLPLDGLPQPTLVAADLRQLAQQLNP